MSEFLLTLLAIYAVGVCGLFILGLRAGDSAGWSSVVGLVWPACIVIWLLAVLLIGADALQLRVRRAWARRKGSGK